MLLRRIAWKPLSSLLLVLLQLLKPFCRIWPSFANSRTVSSSNRLPLYLTGLPHPHMATFMYFLVPLEQVPLPSENLCCLLAVRSYLLKALMPVQALLAGFPERNMSCQPPTQVLMMSTIDVPKAHGRGQCAHDTHTNTHICSHPPRVMIHAMRPHNKFDFM